QRDGPDPGRAAARSPGRRGARSRGAGVEPCGQRSRGAGQPGRGAARWGADRVRCAGRAVPARGGGPARRRGGGAARPGGGVTAAYWVWRRELAVMLRAPVIYVVGGVFLAVQGVAFGALVIALSDPRRPAPLGALLEGQLSGTWPTWVLEL